MEKATNKIVLKNVRGFYVFLKDPRKKKDGSDDGYGMQLILGKDHPQLKDVQRVQLKTLSEAFGKEALKRKGKYKLPLRDGSVDHEGEEDYEDSYFFNASNKKRQPGIITRSGKTPTDADWQKLGYSGCYFTVSLNFYPFSKPDEGGKPGIAVGLNNVMLVKSGERVDGTSSAKDDFSEFIDEDLEDIDEDDFDIDDDEDIDF